MTPYERVIVSSAHTNLWLAERAAKRVIATYDNCHYVDIEELRGVLVDIQKARATLGELNARPAAAEQCRATSGDRCLSSTASSGVVSVAAGFLSQGQ